MAMEELLKLMDKWFFARTNEKVYHNTIKPSIIYAKGQLRELYYQTKKLDTFFFPFMMT